MGSGNESPAQWALDLLEPRPEDYVIHYSHYWPVVATAATGSLAVFLRNYGMKRPLLSSLGLNVALTVCGGCFGAAALYVVEVSKARKDAILRDYIKLHPERFPPPKNQKYAELFEEWIPLR